MISKVKNLAAGLVISTLSVFTAQADGLYQMFSGNGDYIDDIEIIGDVTLPSGQTMAALEMRNEHMKFFVDPEGIYVTLVENNPILTEQRPFFGYWISTQSVDIGDRPACDFEVQDEYGAYYQVHGYVMWTNTGMTENYDIAFNIAIGDCGGGEELWAFNNAYFTLNNANAVPHDDIPAQNIYTVVDSSGEEFILETIDTYSILTSVAKQKIVVSMATSPVTYESFYEQEVILLNSDCSTSSQHHGYGTWSWANGGFIVDFYDISFSFPRMDSPPDDTGACRM